jgi:hypothetical protein
MTHCSILELYWDYKGRHRTAAQDQCIMVPHSAHEKPEKQKTQRLLTAAFFIG